jgi:GDP/UDP-N,N'-diacetylbacillosamine 2-epimerase (hydrolysing)
MNPPRKICMLTGKRGGMGALFTVLECGYADPDLQIDVIATDMHVSDKFGKTIRELKKYVTKPHAVPLDQANDSPLARIRALSKGMSGIGEVLDSLRPDLFLVLGDRGEVLAAVIAALHLGIPVAHIQGGDISGNVDELMRHAITKLSHIHFPATEDSAERIRKMGEDPWRIHVVGDPHIDFIVQRRFTPGSTVRDKYGIGTEPFLIVLLHPETDDIAGNRSLADSVLDAAARSGLKTLVVYPCSDPGYQGILDAIAQFERRPGFTVFPNVEAVDFWGLLSEAAALIGNSSAGLIEAPYFDLPVVNVGRRQTGRIRSANVIDCTGTAGSVKSALEKALAPEFREELKANPDQKFGDGRAGEKIIRILKTVSLNSTLLNKRMAY